MQWAEKMDTVRGEKEIVLDTAQLPGLQGKRGAAEPLHHGV